MKKLKLTYNPWRIKWKINEIKIINKFSTPKRTVLITNKELPEEIWIGEQAKINDITYTIIGVPISDRNTFVVDKIDKISVGQIVKFYKAQVFKK